MGKADLFEFLGAFVDWFPVVILIPSFLLFFNIQDRFLSIFGIKSVYKNSDDDEESGEGLLDADYEEGKALVLEGKRKIKRKALMLFIERAIKEREMNPNARLFSGRQPHSPVSSIISTNSFSLIHHSLICKLT